MRLYAACPTALLQIFLTDCITIQHMTGDSIFGGVCTDPVACDVVGNVSKQNLRDVQAS